MKSIMDRMDWLREWTGSGKSEFIMTYILSLAVNYHPYEVAFVLIDYKGGGMAKHLKYFRIPPVLLLIRWSSYQQIIDFDSK